MKRAVYSLPVLIIIVSFACEGYGEESSSDQSGIMSAEYSQGLNYERWQGLLEMTKRFDENKSFYLNEQLTVWLHDIPGYHPQWKVDQKLDYELSHRVTSGLSWLVSGSLDRFLDRRTDRIGNDIRMMPMIPLENGYSENLPTLLVSSGNSLIEGFLGVGFEYSFQRPLNAKLNFGPLLETKDNMKQEGFRMSAEVSGTDEISDWKTSGWRDHLPNGSDYGLMASFNGNYMFSEQASDRFSVDYSLIDRQQQFAVGVPTDHKDESIKLSNHLKSGIATNLPVTWKSVMTRQRIEHLDLSGNFNGLTYIWNNDVEMDWNAGTTLLGRLSGGIDIRQQQFTRRLYQGEQINPNSTISSLNRGKRIYFGFSTSYLTSVSDSLTISSQAARYRFDTPDETDKNDRDELRYISSVRYSKMILPNFVCSVNLEVDLNHIVYIFRPRSIENRWTRLFSLSSELPWQGELLNNSARFKVVSNYSDYDYSPATESQSRVYRSFSAEDSLSINLSKVLSLEIDVALILDDHGRFRWDEWVQDLSEDGISTSTSIQSLWKIDQYSAGLGWLWHKRQTTIHLPSDQTQPGESVLSSGPKFSFVYPHSEDEEITGLQVRLEGSIVWVSDRLRGDYKLPDFRLSAAYTF